MDEQTTHAGLEEAKNEVIANRNGREYFLICEDLGEEPEAKYRNLYEKGQLEVELERATDEHYATMSDESKYANFYKEGNRLNIRDFGRDAESKKRLLRTYFPGRFGENGTQSLENLTNERIGSLFKGLVEYSAIQAHQ